ncbi:membrane protein insertion efficiency factor YidD [Desulfonatronovibrio magnus]|uniref:membrane protein insertion efficiency factor YidD n=1 Tax=Desulfonatronovibrio magnus TaxID=698827 RepID=UPI000A07B478|nr:membrane protein insertion efficiency factor YidD [Desulfonatronovibrio magnus]
MRYIIIIFIKLYQKVLSPLIPGACRFYPSCSHYAVEAFHMHGAAKGTLLTVYRLLRCNPLCRPGVDPVPQHFSLNFFPWSMSKGTRAGQVISPTVNAENCLCPSKSFRRSQKA